MANIVNLGLEPTLPAMAETLEPKMQAALLTGSTGLAAIGKDEIAKAAEILHKYKNGKQNLEDQIVANEQWYDLRHWDIIRKNAAGIQPEPTSAWLHNAITTKHADAMDNIPEPIVQPREQSDDESAKMLSKILPVVMEYNDFEETYDINMDEKLKHGTAVYGVFWNQELENGLGDIDIKPIDLLKLFWEPGITNIQKSKNVFLVDLVDEETLEQQYPEHKGKLGGKTIDVKQYAYNDQVDITGKSVVVDWYYKVKSASGKTVVHYAKFVGDTLLYASQNDPLYSQTGWYEHGKYPFVFDVLFREKGTPCGFGMVSICKDPQMYIDKLSSNIMENSMMATKKRFFISESAAINKEQFLNWAEPFVNVAGEITDRKIQEIETRPLDGVYLNVMQMKIEEMKETAANRDANNGGTSASMTAAAAIAAVQEAGNKVSRDLLSTTYRAYKWVCVLCIELMRQFYDEARAFRITGMTPGSYDFVEFSNAGIKDQAIPPQFPGDEETFRRPIFDVKPMAQKKNPFSRMEQNERAKELYGLGFFNPERAQEALGALDMMDFEGIDKVRDQVQQGQTLLNICKQLSQQMDQMAQIIQATTGFPMTGDGAPAMGVPGPAPAPAAAAPAGTGSSDTIGSKVMDAQVPMTSYGQRLAKRSAPSMDAVSNKAMPR